MKQKDKALKQSPILNKNWHKWMRLFLRFGPESDWLHQIHAYFTNYPQHLFSPTEIYQWIRSQQDRYLMDGVFACLLTFRRWTNTFFEIDFIGLIKGVRWWGKHRLWERPFRGAKLRQQGSPTIFAGWPSPTILPISCFTVAEFTTSLRGHHAR